MRSSSNSTPDDSSHGDRQKRRTLFKSYLRDFYNRVKYQYSYQAFEVSCWQTESDQETTRKPFRKPPRA